MLLQVTIGSGPDASSLSMPCGALPFVESPWCGPPTAGHSPVSGGTVLTPRHEAVLSGLLQDMALGKDVVIVGDKVCECAWPCNPMCCLVDVC